MKRTATLLGAGAALWALWHFALPWWVTRMLSQRYPIGTRERGDKA